MTATAHPDDVLIVSSLTEHAEHRGFSARQVIPLGRIARLNSLGNFARTIWLTDQASSEASATDWGRIRHHAEGHGADVIAVRHWKPEPKTLGELIAALPEQNATSGRDFGRGYAKAIKDVLALIVSQADANGIAQ